MSDPITLTNDNQIVSGQTIIANGVDGISGSGLANVTIQNCTIYHSGARGIFLQNCPNATITGCNIISTFNGASTPGPEGSLDWFPIHLLSCDGSTITNVLTQNGNGVRLQTSDSVVVQYLQMINNRGRNTVSAEGGGFGFDTCTNCSLLDFYIKNDLSIAWTGDNINCYHGSGHTIARGVIDGNNSPTGAGVQLEVATGCSVTDVDFINWAQQGFSCTDAPTNGNTYLRCRAGYNYTPCTQGRGSPSAGSPPAFDNLGATTSGTVFSACGYHYVASPNYAGGYYNEGSDSGHDITDAGAFTTRAHFTWSSPVAPTGNDTYTKILLHMQGANNGTVFTDDNLGGLHHVWTANGKAVTSTAQKKFGQTSLQVFNTALPFTNDFISTPASPEFVFGSGDWTIDFWLRTDFLNSQFVMGQVSTPLQRDIAWYFDIYYDNNTHGVLLANTSTGGQTNTLLQIQSTTLFTTAWNHVAFVRIGNILKLFVNGVQEGGDLAVTGSTWTSSSPVLIGASSHAGLRPGNVAEFRLSVGIARWTSNFIPPSVPYGPDTRTTVALNTAAATVASEGRQAPPFLFSLRTVAAILTRLRKGLF